MSDIIINLNNKSNPRPIKYTKSIHGFSDSNNDNNKYLFELKICGKTFGEKYFRNIEDNKYSHLIKLIDKIDFNSIDSYKAVVSVLPSDLPINYNLEGIINKDFSSSTQRSENLYIEFTSNDNGYTMCCCFYTGLDGNKIFASPPS
jgi:hypothetical protein